MTTKMVIIGGGPAGNQAATTAARLGAEVTLVERDVVGGAAHLWDCIPSKAMIATGGAMGDLGRAKSMGMRSVSAELDLEALGAWIGAIQARLEGSVSSLLRSQDVRMVHGSARLVSPYEVEIDGPEGIEVVAADVIVLATGSRPRIPEWATVDGNRVLTTHGPRTRRPSCPST